MKKFNFYTGMCTSPEDMNSQFYIEQHRIVRNVLPYVYGLVLLTAAITVIIFSQNLPALISTYLPLILLAVSVIRMRYWVSNRAKFERYTLEQIRADLKGVLLLTPILTAGFASVGFLGFLQGDGNQQISVMFFTWSVGLVFAFSITVLPVLAIGVITMVTLPLVTALLMSGGAENHALAAIYSAISLFAILMVIRLFVGFKEMTVSKAGVIEKNTQLENARQQVLVATTTDPKTGLMNRTRFQELVTQHVEQMNNADRKFLVGLIGIGGLKRVSSLIGHNGRDVVLARVAQRLGAALGKNAIIARHRSDEFAIMIDDISGASKAFEVGELIKSVVTMPIEYRDSSVILSVACGFAFNGSAAKQKQDLNELAGFALYEAWEKGGSKIAVFDHGVREHFQRRAAMEQALELAIKNDEFSIVFQPIYDLKTHQPVAAEALARWTHEKMGTIRPDEFISIAERTGQIGDLTELLLYRAACTAATWPKNTLLSFNFSGSLFADRTIGLKVLSILAKSGLSPHRLELEITETAAISSSQSAAKIIKSLRQAGVKIALDDFGTGYASISQLTAWPLDKVKVDKSLVDDIVTDSQKRNLLSGILEMISALEIPCVVEGIESKDQLNIIEKMPCDFVQGYYFSKPLEDPFAGDTSNLKIGRPNLTSTGQA